MRRSVVAICAALAGCGGGYKAAEAPPQSGGQSPTGTTQQGEVPDAKPMVVQEEQLRDAQASFDDAAKAFTAAGSDCARLCKALSSMSNATSRLCDLAKDGPEAEQKKCADAKERLTQAEAKVKSSCGGCS